MELIIALLLFLVHDYQHPDQDDWYAGLKQPDNPSVSCCGKTDAYWADKVDECKPDDVVFGPYGYEPCFLVAIITDERKIDNRYILPPGTRVAIPQSKIRKKSSQNPTEHNILFVSPQKLVYCWEPLPLI